MLFLVIHVLLLSAFLLTILISTFTSVKAGPQRAPRKLHEIVGTGFCTR